MERPFGMGAQPLNSPDEVINDAAQAAEEEKNPVTIPGPAPSPAPGSYPVKGGRPTAILGGAPARPDSRMGYKK